ncbi:hypothetical protein MTO96_041501 [Rhipicephalus appendiculatus]
MPSCLDEEVFGFDDRLAGNVAASVVDARLSQLVSGSNATGRDAKVQATVEEKADVPTQDSQNPTKAAEEMAEAGSQRDCQETIQEDMSDSGEIGTSEASAEDTAATAGSVPEQKARNAT